MKTTATLRKLMREKGTVWLAGAYDAMSARLIEQAGFDAVFTTGFGISSSFLGLPDAELYTMTENLQVVRNAVNTVTVPLLADADTGYGNAINVMRTVREFENAGVAGLVFEDQVSPKRCPACSDMIEILNAEDATSKIAAAVAARRDPDLVIVARTDALTEEEAIHRARLYVGAGADLIQPISKCFKNIAGLRALRKACGVPLSLQLLGWLEKDLTPAEIEEVAGLATFPLVPLMTVARALTENLAELRLKHSSKGLPRPVADHNEFTRFIGFPEIEDLQRKYLRASI